MVRRLAVPLLLALALTGSLLCASPAHATIQAKKCWQADAPFGWKGYFCLIVNYRRDADGKGGWVDLVRIDAEGVNYKDVFSSKMEDCDNLRLWNDLSVVKWRKDDAECDLWESDPSKTWYPGGGDGLHLDNTTSLNFGWTIYPHIQGLGDPGYTHISLKIDVS